MSGLVPMSSTPNESRLLGSMVENSQKRLDRFPCWCEGEKFMKNIIIHCIEPELRNVGTDERNEEF
jgi:hypothetical protein